jgi:hypothetical protein
MIYSFIHGEGLMRFIIVMYALGMIALGRDYLWRNHALAAPEEQEEQKVKPHSAAARSCLSSRLS